jgi:ligand-binding sensor domain-containing protein
MGLYEYHKGELSRTGNDTSVILYAVWYDNNHILLAKENAIVLMNIHTMENRYIYENTNLPAFRISAFYCDTPNGKLWAGTVSDGLFYYEFDTGVFVRFPVHSFSRQPVRAIAANSDSTLLVGSLVVSQITHKAGNPHSLSNNNVNGIMEDSKGNIWFATNTVSTAGICCQERYALSITTGRNRRRFSCRCAKTTKAESGRPLFFGNLCNRWENRERIGALFTGGS